MGYQEAERWLDVESHLERQGLLDVVYPDMAAEPAVHSLLRRFADQDLSYVDAFSLFTVQSRGDIDAIFAFDHHLTILGVTVLPGGAE
jgi:hypothetical protein